MGNQKGFSLIELLIVVAIILIVAAIAVPSLMRARIASNESAMVGDIRAVISAEATFQGASGHYGDVTCLNAPTACFPGAGTVLMIDTVLSLLQAKNGYGARVFSPGPPPAPMPANTSNLMEAFGYGSAPSAYGRTGYKAFAGDYTGILCWEDQNLPAMANGEIAKPCLHVLGS